MGLSNLHLILRSLTGTSIMKTLVCLVVLACVFVSKTYSFAVQKTDPKTGQNYIVLSSKRSESHDPETANEEQRSLDTDEDMDDERRSLEHEWDLNLDEERRSFEDLFELDLEEERRSLDFDLEE